MAADGDDLARQREPRNAHARGETAIPMAHAGVIAHLGSRPNAALLLRGIARLAADQPSLRTTRHGVLPIEHFDPPYHLRWEQVADRRFLARTIETRLASPLAPHRPLWELHCFALPEGAALLLKVSATLEREAGGAVGLLENLARACADESEPAVEDAGLLALPGWALDRARGALGNALGLLDGPLERLRGAVSELPTPDLLFSRARDASAAGAALAGHALEVARSLGLSLNERAAAPTAGGLAWPVGGRRRVGAFDLPLGALEALGAGMRTSVGTLVLAGTSSALARLESDRGVTVPDVVAARVGLPDLGTTELLLPLGHLSPLARAERIHTSLAGRLLERDQPVVGALAAGLTALPRTLSWLARPIFGASFALSIRVEAPRQEPQTIAGARIERLYPIVGSTRDCALTIGALPRDGRLGVSFTVDEEALPQPEILETSLRSSFAELCASRPGSPAH